MMGNVPAGKGMYTYVYRGHCLKETILKEVKMSISIEDKRNTLSLVVEGQGHSTDNLNGCLELFDGPGSPSAIPNQRWHKTFRR